MRALRRRRENVQRQLEEMEGFLMGALAPVSPSQQFVAELRKQLSMLPMPEPLPPAKIGIYTFFALVSVLGGMLLIAVLIRNILSLIAVISLINQKQQK